MLMAVPDPTVPPDQVMLVPGAVSAQPVPATVPTGFHVMFVAEKLLAAPRQFDKFSVPIGLANAAVADVRQSTAVTAAIPKRRRFTVITQLSNLERLICSNGDISSPASVGLAAGL
jgi:hypothetical protein